MKQKLYLSKPVVDEINTQTIQLILEAESQIWNTILSYYDQPIFATQLGLCQLHKRFSGITEALAGK